MDNDNENFDDVYEGEVFRDLVGNNSNLQQDYYDLSNVDVDEVAFHNFDLESKYKGVAYRSVEVETMGLGHSFEPFQPTLINLSGPPALSKRGYVDVNVGKEAQQQFLSPTLDQLANWSESDSSLATVPKKPFPLLATHFMCVLGINMVVQLINERLQKTLELSFQFNSSKFKWNAVYLRGSCMCKIEIHIFKENDTSYIVEVNRLSGDSITFRSFYNELKTDFSCRSDGSGRYSDINSISGFAVPSVSPISDHEMSSHMKPLKDMLSSIHSDVQSEGCQMICDLSAQEDMHYALASSGCVFGLIECVTNCQSDLPFFVKQYAVCALANISASQTGLDSIFESIMCSRLCKELVVMSCDGGYDTVEMRRECSRILKNLCKEKPSKIKDYVGASILASWVASVDELKDQRLKLHSECARSYLQCCM